MAATSQLVAGVVCATVLGVLGGYATGVVTEAGVPGPSGTPSPLGGSAGDAPRPTAPPTTATPVPDDTPALEISDLRYIRETFGVEAAVKSTVSLHVPQGWRETEPRPDREQFTDPRSKRWIRIDAGFTITRPPDASREVRIKELEETQPPLINLEFIKPDNPDFAAGVRKGRDGQQRRYSTLIFSYLPEPSRSTRLVMLRWVGTGEDGNAEVEISVTGLPQDAKALERILDRATDTVTRKDQ